jgi:hypothetical protein
MGLTAKKYLPRLALIKFRYEPGKNSKTRKSTEFNGGSGEEARRRRRVNSLLSNGLKMRVIS